ncbi:MAG: DNA-directed RNA polymerase subunit alpha, partial [Patescibacteria group bacterium]
MMKPQFAIKPLIEESDYAKVSIEPLEQGYGHTIGNALRRTLLTSIKGAGVAQVRINGVKHKFSTLEGMKEDVVDFILQLKQMRVKYDGEEAVELNLDVTGKEEVLASDIETPSGVEIINKDLVLAHLTGDKARLKATITVDSGYGYKLAEERKTSTLGVIPLDTAYSPVRRVKYEVKETRVGGRTDLDNLVMDIWTDGTISPSEAITAAAGTLMGYFDQIVNPVVTEEPKEDEESQQESEVMRLTV